MKDNVIRITKEEWLIHTIRFLRFPLIVGVVVSHSYYRELVIDGVAWMKGGHLLVYSSVAYSLSEIIARIAVPLFFVISVFLFFYKVVSFDGRTYWRKIRKRARTLLVPCLFWNLAVIMILFLSQTFLPQLMSGNKKLICDYTVSHWLWSFWNMEKVNPSDDNLLYAMPVCYPLWFIRDLMVVMLFSPLVYFIVKKSGLYAVSLLGALWLFDDSYFGITGLNITAFFFFSAGAYFSIFGKNLVEKAVPYLTVSAVLYGVMSVTELIFREQGWSEYLHRADILVGIILAVAVTARLVGKGKWKVNPFLSDSCFFIYAFHAMPLALVFKFLFKMLRPHSDGMMLAVYLVSPTLVILAGLGFYFLLKKYLPEFTAVITGGR